MEKIKKISITFVTMLLAVVVVGLCPFMSMKVKAWSTVNLDGKDGMGDFTDSLAPNCTMRLDNGVLTIRDNASGASINRGAFYYSSSPEKEIIKELIIDGDIEIGESAFNNNVKLKAITVKGAKISNTNSFVFSQCTELKKVYMSDDVTLTSFSTFYNCPKLESVRLPDSMTELPVNTFSGCSSLKKIELPHNISKIRIGSFTLCTNLESIIFPNSLTEIQNIFNGGAAPLSIKELIFQSDVPQTITGSDLENWLKNSEVLGSLIRIVVPDDCVDAYTSWLEGYGIDPTKVTKLIVKYSEAFPNGRDEDGDGDNDHEGGSNDDESRPAPPTPNQMAQDLIFRLLEEQIAAMDSSSNRQATIDGNELVNGLPNATMKKIADTPNAVVFFKFIYDGVHYTTAIPTDAVFDTSVDWYGPLYMMNVFPTMQETATGAVPYVPVVAPVQ